MYRIVLSNTHFWSDIQDCTIKYLQTENIWNINYKEKKFTHDLLTHLTHLAYIGRHNGAGGKKRVFALKVGGKSAFQSRPLQEADTTKSIVVGMTANLPASMFFVQNQDEIVLNLFLILIIPWGWDFTYCFFFFYFCFPSLSLPLFKGERKKTMLDEDGVRGRERRRKAKDSSFWRENSTT